MVFNYIGLLPKYRITHSPNIDEVSEMCCLASLKVELMILLYVSLMELT